MKNKILTLAFSLITLIVFSQNFQGEAIYKSHRKMDFDLGEQSENSALKKQLQDQLRSQSTKEYTLSFTRKESFYAVNASLSSPKPSSSGISLTIKESTDTYYKNLAENRFTSAIEIYGKQFLVKDTLKPIHWKLVEGIKSIGVYSCRKALFKENYTSRVLNEKGEFTTSTKERITTAWYTLEVPVNNGPANFYGLLGLILEINDGELTLVCTRLTLNPKKQIKISEPKRGKKVNQETFNEIKEKKSKEMRAKLSGGRNRNRSIIIGG